MREEVQFGQRVASILISDIQYGHFFVVGAAGFSGSGLGAALEVAAFEYGRNGLLLNGGGICVPLFSDGAQQRLGES